MVRSYPSHDRDSNMYKIYYFGPGLSGCSTSIDKVLRRCLDAETAGRAVWGERLEFATPCPALEHLPRGRWTLISGRKSVIFDLLRLQLLRDIDGVVFVADLQPQRLQATRRAMEVLQLELAYHGISLAPSSKRPSFDIEELVESSRSLDIQNSYRKMMADLDALRQAKVSPSRLVPFVLQLNKNDIRGVLHEHEVIDALGFREGQVSAVTSHATQGKGVLEAFEKLAERVVSQ